jgi:gamma-glutamyltranspeptidase
LICLPQIRRPLSSFYQGYQIFAPPPPFSGAVLLMSLNILERYNLAVMGPQALSYHYLVRPVRFLEMLPLGHCDHEMK